MTVIAWDGKTLAADKRVCFGGQIGTVTKIFRIGDRIIGFEGYGDAAAHVRSWFQCGAHPSTFPDFKDDRHAYCLSIKADGVVERFERTGHAYVLEDEFCAFGSGAPYALAAMYLGMDAKRAVEIACKFDEHCGNGVDTLTLEALSE